MLLLSLSLSIPIFNILINWSDENELPFLLSSFPNSFKWCQAKSFSILKKLIIIFDKGVNNFSERLIFESRVNEFATNLVYLLLNCKSSKYSSIILFLYGELAKKLSSK